MIAAFVATAIMAMLMVAKGSMGVMPQLEIPSMLASMIGASGNLNGLAGAFYDRDDRLRPCLRVARRTAAG